MGSSVIFAVALVFAVLFLLEWTLGRLDPYAHARWAFIPLLTERIEVSDAMRSSLRASGALTGDDLRDDRMPWPRAFEDGGRRWEPPVADHHGFLRVKWFPSALVRSPPAGTVRVSARLRGERLVVRAAYLPDGGFASLLLCAGLPIAVGVEKGVPDAIFAALACALGLCVVSAASAFRALRAVRGPVLQMIADLRRADA